MDPVEADTALDLDAAWIAGLRASWLDLIDLAVFGQITSPTLHVTGKLQKRTLELGERLRAFAQDRRWIPQPRERMKNALATAIALRETRDALRTLEPALDAGPARYAFAAALARFDAMLETHLPRLERAWAAILDRPLREPADE
jgi:hypothetical protein